MKIYEITFSPTGGTEKAADMVLKGMEKPFEKISLLGSETDYSRYVFTPDDLCLIAVPSFGGRVPETAVRRLLQTRGNGARCILMAVYGNRDYEDTLLELKNMTKLAGFVPAAAVAAVAEHSIMRQFAAGRPDPQDEKELESFGAQIAQKLKEGGLNGEAQVPGNTPYKEFHVIPMRPKVSKKCNGCGICVKECPVKAIDEETKKVTGEKCISCMRCIAVCPQEARALDKVILKAASMKLKNACSGHKLNRLFW